MLSLLPLSMFTGGFVSGGAEGYMSKMKPPMVRWGLLRLPTLFLCILNLSIKSSLCAVFIQGWNSWNCYHSGVTSADLKSTADFFVSSGLSAAGYSYVNTDGKCDSDCASPACQGNVRREDGVAVVNLTC